MDELRPQSEWRPGPGARPTAPSPGRERGIVRPSLAFAAVDVAGKVLGLVVVIVLARRLTEDQFGQVVALLAGANVLLALFDFGMNLHLVSLVVQDRQQVREALSRRYQLLGAITGVALGASLLPALRSVAVCAAAGAAMATLPTGVLLAGQAPAWAACSLVGPNLLFLGLIVTVPASGSVRTMDLWTVANLATLALLWRGVDWIRPKRRPQIGVWDLHRRSLSLAVFNLVVLAYGRLDTVLVALLVSSAVAGVYGTSYRVVLAAVGVASWSANVAAQGFREAEGGIEQLRRVVRYAAALAVLMGGALLVVLRPAVDVLLGRHVELPMTTVLAFAALPLPLMVANPITYFVVIRGRQHQLTTASLVAAAVGAALYPLAIRAFGMTGGATSSLVIEALALALFARAALPSHNQRLEVAA